MTGLTSSPSVGKALASAANSTSQPVAAGFKVDNLKVAVPAGERKPLTVTLTAPQQPKIGSLAALRLPEEIACTIAGTLKGGVPASKAAAGKRVFLDLRCQLYKQ